MPSIPVRRPYAVRPVKLVLAVIGVVVVLAVLACAAFVFSLANTFDSSRHTFGHAFPAASSRPPVSTGRAAQAVNILLLGTDVDAADPESPQMVGKRESDTVMVIHVPADRKHVYVMSILRNSLVHVPGHGEQPINAAYAYGGGPLAVQTVEGVLDVRIDHVVALSLSGMKGLTDTIGGVTVTNRQEIVGKDGDVFPPGRHQLDGTEALSFLRAGDFRAVGDEQRVSAQESYFRAVFHQMLSAKTLLEPVTIGTAVSLFSPYLTTDKGFDAAAVGSLGFSLRNVRDDDVELFHLPTDGISTVDGATVVNLDAVGVTRVSAAFKADTLENVAG